MSTDTTTQTCTITVDGVPVVVPAGALLIEALKMQGIDIPNFCYYHNLPAQASCRMCLVRIEKMPRLQPSCTTVVRDGMAVEINTPEILDMRRGMLEFMLANHPLDCPVCDRGGECELQDNAFKFGRVDARFTEEKHPAPDVDISPFIYNDAQRCVFCYRCIRVCDIWMDVGALAKLNRGAHETIGTFDGWLDCEHCGNCVDVCPTGTLLHTSYKFGPRPWTLDETETTCSYCADGCRVRLGSRGDTVHRSIARDGTGINEEFLCVKGRYGFGYINSGERVTQPLVRKNGELHPATWDDALEHVAKRLGEVSKAKGADAVAVLGSTRITNEGNFAVAEVAKAIGTPNISYEPDYDLSTFMKSVGGRLATKADVLSADVIFVIGGDPKEDQPLTAHHLVQPVFKGKAALYVASSRLVRIRKRASKFVHLRPGGEAALLLGLAGGSLEVAAKAAGCAPSDIESLRSSLEGGRKVVVMVGSDCRGAALEAASSLGSLLAQGDREVTYRPLVFDNNSIGAFDVLGQGVPYASITGSLGDSISALYAVGADLMDGEDAEAVRARLGRLDFLVVQDLFMTDAALLAEVVLPASTYAEQDGTFTNIAGEVQRVHKAIDPVGSTRPDWLIASQIARLLGAEVKYRGSVSAVYRSLTESNPAYANATYVRMMTEGAVQTERPSASPDRSALVSALTSATAATDTTARHNEVPTEMGERLFHLGTIGKYSKLLADAFEDGKAKGRSVEEEAALIPLKSV